jgi:L-lactate permease
MPNNWLAICWIRYWKAPILLLSLLQKLFFWNYARNTWQWDVLCVVILIFIFLTPKSWFENSERRGFLAHQNSIASTVLVGPELIENVEDRGRIEQVVRSFTGRTDVKVLNVRKVVDNDGKTRGYEVDIR